MFFFSIWFKLFQSVALFFSGNYCTIRVCVCVCVNGKEKEYDEERVVPLVSRRETKSIDEIYAPKLYFIKNMKRNTYWLECFEIFAVSTVCPRDVRVRLQPFFVLFSFFFFFVVRALIKTKTKCDPRKEIFPAPGFYSLASIWRIKTSWEETWENFFTSQNFVQNINLENRPCWFLLLFLCINLKLT